MQIYSFYSKDVDVQFDSSIEDYLSTIKCYNEKAAKRLDETEQVMHELEKGILIIVYK